MIMTDIKARNSIRAALLGSAVAFPLLAASGATAQTAGATCIELQNIAGQIDFVQSEITRDDVIAVIEVGDDAECAVWLTDVRAAFAIEGEIIETERARVRLEDEVVIEGRVIVDQRPPSVQVDEQAVEVMVGVATPEVSVTEGQVDILVRQAAPMITFDMPQPTITIVQPAPEIIITMPDPSVDVATARPQVEVRQAQPRVSISMPDPTVELELYQAEDAANSPGIVVERREATGAGATARDPAVTFARADAQVVYQEDSEAGQPANVTLSRSIPNVRIEQAEPQIEITAAGDPQVNWSLSGEPVVTFLDGSQTEATNSATTTGAMGAPSVRRDGYQRIDMAGLTGASLDGAVIYGVRGDEIAEIGALAADERNAQHVIVDVGGFLGMGERQVRVPLTDISVLQQQTNGEVRAYVNASEERLMAYPEVN